MGSSWKNRGTYGRILNKIIKKQLKRFETENDLDKANQLSHNIGYLTNILNGIIKDAENSLMEKRLEELEKKVGM